MASRTRSKHITHSLCTLEFEDHRPLYDWFLENLPVPSRPRQIEFARLNLTYTVLSKRVLTELVRGGHVSGLGRSAHADAGGSAPARRAAGGFARFRRPHRRRQGQQHGRRRHVRIFHPRGAEQERAAAHGGAAAAQGGDRELSGRADRGARGGQSSRRSGRRHAQDPFRPRDLYRAAKISWRIRRRNSSGSRPAPRCGCATPISSPAARW